MTLGEKTAVGVMSALENSTAATTEAAPGGDPDLDLGCPVYGDNDDYIIEQVR